MKHGVLITVITLMLISSCILINADRTLAEENYDPSPDPPPITDEYGRQLILRGCNYPGLEYGGFNHRPEDLEQMASWGFNVVRLPIAWAYLEPEPDVWDETYLTDHVLPSVQWAADAGLYVILDMHQWKWSPCCDGNGIPAWTCEGGVSGDFCFIYESGVFWDHPEYLDHFVQAWAMVASFFAGDERIIAYDLWNEPTAGLRSFPWTSENQLYRPLFIRFIEAIRAIDPDRRLIVEPTILNSTGFFSWVMDPLPYEQLIYEPHVYPGFCAIEGIGYWVGPEFLRSDIQQRFAESKKAGLPLFVGEFGIGYLEQGAADFAHDSYLFLDEVMAHAAWWSYGRDDGMALLFPDGAEKPGFLNSVDRPYPQVTAGRLQSFGFDQEEKIFTVRFRNISFMAPEIFIYIPAKRHWPDGFIVNSTDRAGYWSWKFYSTESILHVHADPEAAEHEITVQRKTLACRETHDN